MVSKSGIYILFKPMIFKNLVLHEKSSAKLYISKAFWMKTLPDTNMERFVIGLVLIVLSMQLCSAQFNKTLYLTLYRYFYERN